MNSFEIIDQATELIQSAKFGEAETLLNGLPNVEENAAAQQLLGIITFQTERPNNAAVHFLKAANDLTEDGYLQNNLGQTYLVLGKHPQAIEAFQKAAELQPEFADPLNYLGLLERQRGNLKHAEMSFNEAIKRRPEYAEAHFNLGALLHDQNRFEIAKDHYQQALESKPGYLQAINNLGALMSDLGDHEAAEGIFLSGLSENPSSPELLTGYGSCLRMQSRYDEAAAAFVKAISAKDDFVEAKWNLGFLQLAMGKYTEGWANYRYRHSVDRTACSFPEQPWGEDLAGRKISLMPEQGLGDEIFFLRFAVELARRGADVTYRPDSKLSSLAARIDHIKVASGGASDISIADLPYLLDITNAIPSIIISLNAAALAKMKSRLSEVGPAPYIGVTYRAGGAGANTLVKNAPIEGIAAALKNVEATLIDVQRLPTDQERQRLAQMIGRQVANFSDINDNLEDALALMTLLDDYVGVSNTNMHLRAAAGKTAKVLVTHPGEYRWLVEGDQSPWFPGFDLYRQSKDGQWQEAFAKLTQDLEL